MQGDKTQDQVKRRLERKDDRRSTGGFGRQVTPDTSKRPVHPERRGAEFPATRRGMNQEHRRHHKHDGPTP